MKNEKNIGHEIKTLSNLIKRYMYNSSVRDHCNQLSAIQGHIIGYLINNTDKDIFQKDIEEKFTIRRSTVTGVLKSMEKNNLIKREGVTYDARLKKIVLTEFGNKVYLHIVEEIKKFEETVTKGVSKEELEFFVQILGKFKKNLE